MLRPVSMTLTLMQGHSGSAKAKHRRRIISTTKPATSIKLSATISHFLYYICPWLYKPVYGLTILLFVLLFLVFLSFPVGVCVHSVEAQSAFLSVGYALDTQHVTERQAGRQSGSRTGSRQADTEAGRQTGRQANKPVNQATHQQTKQPTNQQKNKHRNKQTVVTYLLTHTYLYTHTRMHARTRAHIHTHTHARTHARTYTHKHTHAHARDTNSFFN